MYETGCCLEDYQRRRLLMATLAAGGLMLLPSRSWAGDIRDLAGQVWVNRRTVTKRSKVLPGDTVETGAGARIAFIVGNDAYLLKENARIELKADAAIPWRVRCGCSLVACLLCSERARRHASCIPQP